MPRGYNKRWNALKEKEPLKAQMKLIQSRMHRWMGRVQEAKTEERLLYCTLKAEECYQELEDFRRLHNLIPLEQAPKPTSVLEVWTPPSLTLQFD